MFVAVAPSRTRTSPVPSSAMSSRRRRVCGGSSVTAIIGDPRNDSHVFMSQMHLAFARAHNGFVDAARLHGVADADVFTNAARELRWHYQKAVLEEFLPALIGSEMTRQIAVGNRRYYR